MAKPQVLLDGTLGGFWQTIGGAVRCLIQGHRWRMRKRYEWTMVENWVCPNCTASVWLDDDMHGLMDLPVRGGHAAILVLSGLIILAAVVAGYTLGSLLVAHVS